MLGFLWVVAYRGDWRLKGVVEHVCSSQLQQEDKLREVT